MKEKQESVTVAPEQVTEKLTAIDNAGDGEKQKRTRKVLTPSKKELQEKLSVYESKETATLMKGADLKLISNGLFIVIQGLTNLPFMKVDEKLYEAFNDAGAACINKYFPDVGEHAPLFQLGTLSMLIVTSALALKAEEDNKTKKVETSEKVEKTISVNSSKPQK